MGRLAQATRNSKGRLRKVAQDAKEMRGGLQADQLAEGRAYLMKLLRKLPRRKEVAELLDDIRSGWEPQAPEPGKKPKPGAAEPEGDSKKELLRRVLLQAKLLRVLAKQLVEQARQNEQAFALLARPARDVVRAPMPTERFTAAQMDEFLGFVLLFITLIEKLARRMRGA